MERAEPTTRGREPPPGFSRTPPREAFAHGAISLAFGSHVGLGIVPRTIFMHLSLKVNVPKAPEGREALCPLLSPSQSPFSSHTAALLSSIKPPMESVSQTRLQGPLLAAGQQLWVVTFLPFLTFTSRLSRPGS